MNLTGEQPKLVHGINVTSDYFRLYGARILLGHAFTAQEENPGSGKTVVLGYYLWKNSFAGDPHIIGRSITLGGEPYTVIGVVAEEFHTDSLIDLWLPLRVDPASSDPTPFYRVVGRLKSDVTLNQANAQLKAAADRFRERYPGAIPPDRYFLVRPLGDSIIGNARFPLVALSGGGWSRSPDRVRKCSEPAIDSCLTARARIRDSHLSGSIRLAHRSSVADRESAAVTDGRRSGYCAG